MTEIFQILADIVRRLAHPETTMHCNIELEHNRLSIHSDAVSYSHVFIEVSDNDLWISKFCSDDVWRTVDFNGSLSPSTLHQTLHDLILIVFDEVYDHPQTTNPPSSESIYSLLPQYIPIE